MNEISTAQQCCTACRWWQYIDDNDEDPDGAVTSAPEEALGECRRQAPTRSGDPEDGHGYWPFTFGTEYCGDWQQAAERK